MSDYSNLQIIVVSDGYRMYKEDGTDDFLEVRKNQPVRSINALYITEGDYIKLKQNLVDGIHNDKNA